MSIYKVQKLYCLKDLPLGGKINQAYIRGTISFNKIVIFINLTLMKRTDKIGGFFTKESFLAGLYFFAHTLFCPSCLFV